MISTPFFSLPAYICANVWVLSTAYIGKTRLKHPNSGLIIGGGIDMPVEQQAQQMGVYICNYVICV